MAEECCRGLFDDSVMAMGLYFLAAVTMPQLQLLIMVKSIKWCSDSSKIFHVPRTHWIRVFLRGYLAYQCKFAGHGFLRVSNQHH